MFIKYNSKKVKAVNAFVSAMFRLGSIIFFWGMEKTINVVLATLSDSC